MIRGSFVAWCCCLLAAGCATRQSATDNLQLKIPMSPLDQFDTQKPEQMPLSQLPAAAAATVAVTANIANPSGAAALQDGAVLQGVALSTAGGHIILLIGQNDPSENGFYTPDVAGAERVVSHNSFSDHIGPGGEDGHYKQFKVAVTAGTNAGKTYFLASATPALFEDGLRFYELTEDTPAVIAGEHDHTPPDQHSAAEPPFDAEFVCKVAVDANTELPIAGAVTLDGIDLVGGDYYLLKGQTEQSENGVFLVNAEGPHDKAVATGFVRARITLGTEEGKQFSVDQETGEVTSLAPDLHP